MAEIQQNDGGGKKKGHQKKMTIRVDFTPMVDMNMLLITFFMLCTTMIKSQTLSVSLPSNEKVDNVENMNQAASDKAITILIDAKRKANSEEVDSVNGKVVNEIYYYFGKPGGDAGIEGPGGVLSANNNLKKSELLSDENNSARGLRAIIQQRNKQIYDEVKKLKERYNNGEFGKLSNDAEKEVAMQRFQDEVAKVQLKPEFKDKKPVIIIKSTPQASYGALVEVLDEMQINSISQYQIDNMTHEDSVLLKDYWKNHMGQ